VDDALDETLTARENAERRTLWTRTEVIGMLRLQRRDDAAVVRAEVLREAADLIDNDDECGCGGCDTCLARDFATRIRNLALPTA
jgi:hypothetical protein